MTVIGLEDGKVALYPHDEAWEAMAAEMIEKIRTVMKDDILDIQHVGGTSIRCAWAKPIIDIMILVKDYSVINPYIPALNELGIDYLGEMVPGQRLGVIRTPDGKGQTHHIHFAQPDTLGWYEIINIRDFCNTDPLGGKVYSDSKLLYSKGNEDVRLNYREEKNNMYVVIRQAAQAMRERQEGRKTGSNMIDDIFRSALARLEQNAVVYTDGRKPIRYKELMGLAVRAAVKLRTIQDVSNVAVICGTNDIAKQIILLLGALYCGWTMTVTDETDPDALEQLRKNEPLSVTADNAFFEDLMDFREHLREADHKDEDPALRFLWKDGREERLTFKDLSDSVQRKAETTETCANTVLKENHRLMEPAETVRILACLCNGGILTAE